MERLAPRVEAEAVAQQVGLRGEDLVGFALIGGEFPDEAQEGGGIGGRGKSDVKHRSR